jgi:hypothetical protein
MSDTIVLRKVFAIDSNTGLFIPPAQVLTTDGNGGTYWGTLGQPNIISTVGGLGTSGYISTFSLISTVQQLATAGYVSTASVTSTMQGMGTAGYISTGAIVSSIQGLGNSRYVSTSGLVSSIIGLGSAGYISTASLISTSFGVLKESSDSLGTAGYISSASLNSTTAALGTLGYISSASLNSTNRGLGTLGYISTSGLVSTVRGLGTSGYVSTSYLYSTIVGLGTLGYVSSATSVSEIRFDNTGSVTTINSINTFAGPTNVTQIKNNSFSTFIGSSLYYTGNRGAMSTTIINYHALQFSTAVIDFSPFREYIYSSTIVTLDLYPNIAFSKLGTGARTVCTFPISTFLQNVNPNLSSVATTYLNAANTRVNFEDGTIADSSNYYTTPIKLTLRPGTISNYTNPYTVMHYMPSTLNDGQFQNALHSNYITVSYGNTGSLFISIQNSE